MTVYLTNLLSGKVKRYKYDLLSVGAVRMTESMMDGM